MSQLRDAIVEAMHDHLKQVLRAAEIGIPTATQFQAFRTFALDEFGMQGFLPELDALLGEHGMGGKGRAETARKGVPP